ncbi:MAG: secretin N-terminal domain-containing protein [Pseudomonadota bacterium]
MEVYRVQNRPVAEIAAVVQELGSARASANAPIPGDVVPGLSVARGSTSPIDGATSVGGGAGPPGPYGDQASEALRVLSDSGRNALILIGSPALVARALAVTEELDAAASQILLEATIAEVDLTDQFEFGLRWFFEQNDVAASFPGGPVGFANGLSVVLSATEVQASLNALRTLTNIRVLSSPTLLVMDNRTAFLQIGDQVPVVTQSAVVPVDPGAPIVNSVSFRDTGVILAITPRINDHGVVLLDIDQQVSNVIPTTTSSINSPTIQQRQLRTTVSVNDGNSLILGGLIEENETESTSEVPILGQVPVFGELFKTRSRTSGRSELLIVITPRVIRSMVEANDAMDTYRQQLSRIQFSPRISAPADRNVSADLDKSMSSNGLGASQASPSVTP